MLSRIALISVLTLSIPTAAAAQLGNDGEPYCPDCEESVCPSYYVWIECHADGQYGPLNDYEENGCLSGCWATSETFPTCDFLPDCNATDQDIDLDDAYFLADQSPEKIVNDFFDHPNLRHVRERSALAVLSCNGAIAGLFPISESASVALAEAQDGEHLIEALAIAVTVQTPVRAALLEYLASELPRQ